MPSHLARFALSLAIVVASATAQAQIFRAYLASDGSDANPCTLPQPCRLLPAALAAVAAGGEIWILDSANYNTGTVNVDKSVTILAVPGVVGSVVATGSHAISIANPGIKVALRNLVIGRLPGIGFANGVNLQVASSLKVEDTVFANATASGIYAAGPGSSVTVVNSVFRDGGGYGIFVEGGTQADISNTVMSGNTIGVHAKAAASVSTKVTVSGSTISGGNYGVEAFTDSVNGSATISLSHTTIANTGQAMRSLVGIGGASTILVGSSHINANASPWFIAGPGAVIRSYLNNQMFDNGAGSGSLTAVGLQ